ncbi:MAG: lectin-like domain-containing protein [Coprobacillaceae bacterium]
MINFQTLEDDNEENIAWLVIQAKEVGNNELYVSSSRNDEDIKSEVVSINVIAEENVIQDKSTLTEIQPVDATTEVSPFSLIETVNTVNKENFTEYFGFNNAAIGKYDVSTGITTLTPDQPNKIGDFYLKDKISFYDAFTLKGKVNLGSKSKANGGADGIGFGFHPGGISKVGASGNAMGIGKLPFSFGFKLDTYYNGEADDGWLEDPTTVGDRMSFGAFMRCKMDSSLQPAETLGGLGVHRIINPTDNSFTNFTIEYDGNGNLKVTYDKGYRTDIGQYQAVWTCNVFTDLGAIKGTPYAFFVQASTGASYNLQQFQIEEFTYTSQTEEILPGPGEPVLERHVDEKGIDLLTPTTHTGNIGDEWSTSSKEQEIGGEYSLIRLEGDTNGKFRNYKQFVTMYINNQHIKRLINMKVGHLVNHYHKQY